MVHCTSVLCWNKDKYRINAQRKKYSPLTYELIFLFHLLSIYKFHISRKSSMFQSPENKNLKIQDPRIQLFDLLQPLQRRIERKSKKYTQFINRLFQRQKQQLLLVSRDDSVLSNGLVLLQEKRVFFSSGGELVYAVDCLQQLCGWNWKLCDNNTCEKGQDQGLDDLLIFACPRILYSNNAIIKQLRTSSLTS